MLSIFYEKNIIYMKDYDWIKLFNRMFKHKIIVAMELVTSKHSNILVMLII